MTGKNFRISFTLAAVDRASRVMKSFTNSAGRRLQDLEKRISAVSSKARGIGTAMLGAGLVMAASVGAPVKLAMDFEAAMVGLGKQAGVTRDAMGQMTVGGKRRYAELTAEVFKLARVIPMVHEDIAGMMEAGARMGVAPEKLSQFTRTAAMMASAFDAVPQELAEQMAKISNVMDIPIDKIAGLADVINYLDDQSVAQGVDIINILQRVGGAAKFVNMTGTQISALATTFLSMGTAPEVAATGINAMIMKLAAATKGSKSFQAGLSKIGLSAGSIQTGMFKDAEGTIIRVLNAIKTLPQTRQLEVLSDLFGNEYADDVAKLAGGLEKYNEIRKTANSTKAAGSMQAEFNARLTQTSNQLQLVRNRLVEVGIKFGTLLLPVLNRGLVLVTPWIDKLSAWIDKNPELTKRIALVAAGLGGLLIVGGGFLAFLGAVGGAVASGIGYVLMFGRGVATVARVVLGFGRFVMMAGRIIFFIARVALSLNPIGLAINVIAIAAMLLWANWSRVGPLFAQLGNWIKSGIAAGIQEFQTAYQIFREAGGNIVNSVKSGIMSKIDAIKQAMGAVTSAARAYLPFSPAKEGAFRDIHRIRLVETIAESVQPGPLVDAVSRTTAAARRAAIPTSGPRRSAPSSPAASAAGGAQIVLEFKPQITLQGSATAEDEARILQLMRQFLPELERMLDARKSSRERTAF